MSPETVGYIATGFVALIGVLLFLGRHRYRASFRGCPTCADPLQDGLGTGVKDLKATPCIGVEDTGYDMGWDGETVMMSRGRYRCSSCGREFYGKIGYNPFSARLK